MIIILTVTVAIIEQRQARLQTDMVDDANFVARTALKRAGLPFFDLAESLNGAERCALSSDGLHVKQYTDRSRVISLFNRLCDDRMNWRGGAVGLFV